MQVPAEGAAFTRRVSFGRYVLTRLKRAKLSNLAEPVEKKNAQVKSAGRAWEDADELIQDSLANRDAADDALDTTAQDLRFALAGRSRQAAKESPYLDIFYKGIEYYTAAPLDEEVNRYQELITRLEAHLPKEDASRQEVVPILQGQIKDFQEAEASVASARTQDALARTSLLSLQDAWDDLMEKTHAALVQKFDKAKAEKFFPKINRSRSEKDTATNNEQ
jgi:flagellin-specific chaperone FliS